ncbi:hypothetical protein BB561_001178 [Smittium simulii]|uniref:Glycoside hydrolase family 19 catalytic domain-containing protein n=1 Tax=Smittium simulii TaxID=133385 RepID=A0A2T9YVS9_9FUNG|nr:hypothetical protein BB561_001178 [Smittium simulii]
MVKESKKVISLIAFFMMLTAHNVNGFEADNSVRGLNKNMFNLRNQLNRRLLDNQALPQKDSFACIEVTRDGVPDILPPVKPTTTTTSEQNIIPIPSPTSTTSKDGLSVGKIASNMEAAMFLSEILWESDGLKAKEEYACMQRDCSKDYGSKLDFPGKVYSGRGYIQLSWAENYISASMALFGDRRLHENPEQVATNEQIAWDVSFWYWRDMVRKDPRVLQGQFGAATDRINGGIECRGQAKDKAKKRFLIYQKVLAVLSPGTVGIETGCYN